MIYTFYSYKGGVGRSMALANVAKHFSTHGLRVVMLDWDLEAPGLENFFYESESDLNRARSQLGLIDILMSYKRQFPALGLRQEDRSQMADQLDAELAPLSTILTPLDADGSGLLHLLVAGWRAGDRFADYAAAVQSFDWTDFYERFAGEAYFDWLRRQLLNPELADVVLIDSRTGVTEMGGVSTRQLADVVVAFAVPNVQNLAGVTAMVASFKRSDVLRQRGRDLDVVVVPTRIDANEIDKRNAFEKEFERATTSFTPLVFRSLGRRFWDLKLPYVSKYAYEETLAVGNPDSAEELDEAYQALAAHLALLGSSDNARLREVWDRHWRAFGGPPTAGTLPSAFKAPRPNSYFTGRESVLAAVHNRLATDRLAVLQGLRGVGKTQVAIEYVHRHRSEYDVIWWIEASDGSTATQGLADLGAELGLARGAEKQSDAVEAVSQWLTRNERWLLVFDDATPAIGRDLIPPQIGGHILVTSHDPAWSSVSPIITITAMTREEAVEMLTRRTGQHDEEAAAHVADVLGDLPLALELAASYVATTGRSLGSFLERLEHPGTSLLDDSVPGAEGVTASLKSALSALADEDPEALRLLGLASFLAPEPIPLRLLLGDGRPTVEADRALLALRGSGIAEVRGDALTVHPLVQELVRDAIGDTLSPGLALEAIGLAEAALRQAWSDGIRTAPRSVIDHALAAVRHAEEVDAAAFHAPELLLSAGDALRARSDYRGARATLEGALNSDWTRVYTSPQTMRQLLMSLGGVLADLGEFERASNMLSSVVRDAPQPDPFALLALADVLRATDLKAAVNHLWEARSLISETNEELKIDVSLALARALRESGDLGGAAASIEDARRLARSVRGGSDTGRILVELAALRHAENDRLGAVATANQAIVELSRIPRPHRDFGQVVRAAEALVDSEAIEQARLALETVMGELTTMGSSETTEYAQASLQLGRVLAELGDRASAQAAISRSLAVDESIYGPDHPTVARDLVALAPMVDDPVEARGALERATWTAVSTFGPEHSTSVAYGEMLDRLIAESSGGGGRAGASESGQSS